MIDRWKLNGLIEYYPKLASFKNKNYLFIRQIYNLFLLEKPPPLAVVMSFGLCLNFLSNINQ